MNETINKKHTVGLSRDPSILNEDDKERLALRKKLEKNLIAECDVTSISNVRKDCWFLVDSVWLNSWSEFVNTTETEIPKSISTKDLLDETGKPLPNLRPRIDYRGVSSLVFFIFLNLYGHDGSPHICRYEIDIYKHPVPIERLVDIQFIAQKESGIKVNAIRSQWLKWELDDDEDNADDKYFIWCCGLQKEHFEAFLYWLIMCWSRKKSGRSKIKYSAYSPLSNESTHSTGAGAGATSEHGTGERGNETVLANTNRERFELYSPADADYGRHSWIKPFSWFK